MNEKDKEIIEFNERQKEIFEELLDKDDEELIMMVNSGVFNKIIMGYGIAAMEFAGVDEAEITKVKGVFPYVFDSMMASEALEKGEKI